MAKHFHLTISDDTFTFTRNNEAIAAEGTLDGIYVLRVDLPEIALHCDDIVLRYKGIEDIERFIRALDSELDVRPIRHILADRVRAHMFLRLLSDCISWHMKQALAPILFGDHDKPAAAAKRTNPVAAEQRSNEALAEAARKHTTDDTSIHSFTSLLTDLAAFCANHIQPTDDKPAFIIITTTITIPTALQRRALQLLDVSLRLGYMQSGNNTKPQVNTHLITTRGELRVNLTEPRSPHCDRVSAALGCHSRGHR